jgi:serine/threonine-protein kinase
MMYALGADLFQSAGSELLWVDRSGAETALEDELVLSGTGLGGVSLSPDGTRLAFVQSGDQGAQIYVRQMPDGPSSRLTFTGQSLRPAWSPDGRDVVYIGIRDGPSVALRRRADGTGSETVLAREARPVQEIVIAPDGAWLVYRTDNGAPGRGDILARRLTGDTATRELVATPAAEAGPAISPDGRWMAYSSDEGGRTEIFVRPFPEVESGKWQVSRAGGTEPQWGPDGRELFYRSAARDLIEARVETASGFRVTGERAMFSAATYLADDAHPFYAVSRDGRRFVFGRLNLTDQLDASRLILVEHWFTELRPMLKRR